MKKFNKFASVLLSLIGAGFLVYAAKLSWHQTVFEPVDCLIIGLSFIMFSGLVREFSK